MAKSIISNEKKCVVCGTTLNLHKHHIYEGTGRRKKSEQYGCWCYLCAKHHNASDHAVHADNLLDLKLKQKCQEIFERGHGTRAQFMVLFGRNYL